MIPIIGDLIESTVGKVIGGVVDKYLPKSMSEKEKSDMQLEIDKLLLEEEKNNQAQIDAINQTMREEAKSEHWAQWLWRPLVGFTFCGVIINNYILIPYFAKYGMIPIIIPEGIWSAILVVLGVSAGTRGVEKIMRTKNDKE